MEKQPFVKNKWIKVIFYVVVACALLAYPFIISGYFVRFMTTIFMFAALAQVWNIMGGFAGYISLGIVGFVGVGAYGTGILLHMDINFYVALLLIALLAAVIALLIGLPILRLKSGYFSIATFAVAFVLRELSNNWTWLTGGGMGFRFPIRSGHIDGINMFFYMNMLGILLIVTVLCFIISRASLGYGLMAIKEDEDAANVLGINTTSFKVTGFVISGFFAAIIGGIYGNWLAFIDPISAFDTNLSVMVIIMAMVGGAGTVLGPLVGAVVISIISEVLWNNFLMFHQLVLGVILILIVIFMPKGIMDVFLFREEKLTFRYFLRICKENVSKYRV